MQNKKIATMTIVAIAAIAIAIFAIGSSQNSSTASDKQGRKANGAPGSGMKAVKVMPVVVRALRPYVDVGGDVVADIEVSVYPDIGGVISKMNVVIGDSIGKGHAVATVDPSKPGSNYAISDVPSPITGVVTSVPVERGDTVTTSTAIAKVGVIDNLEIDVNLPEADSAKAKKGMSAKVELEAFPGESFDATVTKVSPVLDPTSRTRQIVLSFAKKDGRIAAGMYANVRLFTEEDVGHFVVPSTSIISRDGEDSVFVAVTDESGKKVAKKKVIKFGISVDNQTAITKGLAVGDMVVYEGQDLLADGSEVTIIDGDGK